MSLSLGDILEGKVTGIVKYGAFVSLPEGKSGMVHISEISYNYVNDINESLNVGQEVKVKIIGIDESGKISLSIKKAEAPPKREGGGRYNKNGGSFQRNAQKNEPLSFEDKLKQFMQDSESRMTDIKRRSDKRGGNGGSGRGGR